MWNDPWWMLTCPDRCPMLASLPEAVPDEAAGCPLLTTRKVWETCSCSLRPSPLRPCSFPTLGPQSSLARIPFPWPIGHAAPGWATLLVFKRFSDSSSSVPGERKGGMWETPVVDGFLLPQGAHTPCPVQPLLGWSLHPT